MAACVEGTDRRHHPGMNLQQTKVIVTSFIQILS